MEGFLFCQATVRQWHSQYSRNPVKPSADLCKKNDSNFEAKAVLSAGFLLFTLLKCVHVFRDCSVNVSMSYFIKVIKVNLTQWHVDQT